MVLQDTTVTNGTSKGKLTEPEPRSAVERKRMEVWLKEQIKKGKDRPHTLIVTVTPVLARLLLDHNPINRPMTPGNLSNIASDMVSGRWHFNGEPIIVSDQGNLLDGQHRCEQIIATGMSFEAVMVFGPKEEARYTIDIGKPKTPTNFLAMQGKHHARALAATAGYIIQWRTNNWISPSGGGRPTKTAILDTIEEIRGLEASVEFASEAKKGLRCHEILAFCHYVFKRKAGVEPADDFISKVMTGENLRSTHPAFYCRKRLLEMKPRSEPGLKAQLIFKCWNAWRQEERIGDIRLRGRNLPEVER